MQLASAFPTLSTTQRRLNWSVNICLTQSTTCHSAHLCSLPGPRVACFMVTALLYKQFWDVRKPFQYWCSKRSNVIKKSHRIPVNTRCQLWNCWESEVWEKERGGDQDAVRESFTPMLKTAIINIQSNIYVNHSDEPTGNYHLYLQLPSALQRVSAQRLSVRLATLPFWFSLTTLIMLFLAATGSCFQWERNVCVHKLFLLPQKAKEKNQVLRRGGWYSWNQYCNIVASIILYYIYIYIYS